MTPTSWNSLERVATVLPIRKVGSLYAARCPYHADRNPSLILYPETDSFYCFGCKKAGFLARLAKDLGAPALSSDAFFGLQRIVREKPLVPISPTMLGYYHKQLTPERREHFKARGFDDALINHYLFGYAPDHDRLVIPVWNGYPRESPVYSVRLRAIGNKYPKYIGLKNFNRPALFNKAVLLAEPKKAFIVFGELDALAATAMGLPAVSPTAGVNSFSPEWVGLFQNVAQIIIVPDNTPEEFEPTCRVKSLFDDRAQLMYLPTAVKDMNEYWLKYKTDKVFWENNLDSEKT